jgi:hypothetical protein
MNTQPASARYLHLLLVVAAAAVISTTGGCLAAAAGAGAGAVAYIRGDLEATLPNDYNKVVAATKESIGQLEFAKVSENKDALKAVLVSRTALDKKVEITLTNAGKRQTAIKIRVGIFGDEQLSLAILDKIKSNL